MAGEEITKVVYRELSDELSSCPGMTTVGVPGERLRRAFVELEDSYYKERTTFKSPFDSGGNDANPLTFYLVDGIEIRQTGSVESPRSISFNMNSGNTDISKYLPEVMDGLGLPRPPTIDGGELYRIED